MSTKFINQIQEMLSQPEIISKAASQLGESPSNISTAVSALVPSLLSKVTAMSSSAEGSTTIIDIAKNLFNSGSLNNLSSTLTDDASKTGILNTLLGNDAPKWFESIAQFANIKSSSAQSLSNLVGTSVFGSIGKNVIENNLSASDLTSMLDKEKSFLGGLIPSGLTTILGSLGIGSILSSFTGATGSVVDGASAIIGKGADVISNTAESVVDGASAIVGKGVDVISNTTESVVDGASAVVGKGADVISNTTESVVDGASAVVGKGADVISNTAESVVDGASAVAGKGIDIAKDTADNVVSGVNYVAQEVKEGGSSLMKWLLPLLLIGALVVGAIMMMRGCNGGKPSTTAVNDSTQYNSVQNDSIDSNVVNDSLSMAAQHVETTLTLPSGTSIKAYKGGIEDQLITFIQSDSYKNATAEELKDKWFSFDNIAFDFGKSTLTKESTEQINNIKAILKEFKDVKIKIGAYSDKKGDDAANLKLSQDRANTIKTALTSAQVLSAEGYGEKFATVDENASDKEREADRKISVRLEK